MVECDSYFSSLQTLAIGGAMSALGLLIVWYLGARACCDSADEFYEHNGERRARRPRANRSGNSIEDNAVAAAPRPFTRQFVTVNQDPLTIETLFFPDAKLPCKFYRSGLIDGLNRCGCDRRKFINLVHIGEPKTSLIKILEVLARAKTIELCMYLFTLDVFADLLIELHKRNRTQIRVVSDAGRLGERDEIKDDKIPALLKAGIEVHELPRTGANYVPLLHHKFVIVDKRILFHGSLNWTRSAVTRNQESVVKIINQKTVAEFSRLFNQLFRNYPRAASVDGRDNNHTGPRTTIVDIYD